MSRTRPRLPDPNDVVTGRIRPSIEQLFALIHEVNPTDAPIPAKERAARYAVKARLQSLLIRQHGDTLDVLPTHEGLVSLVHRIDGRDAAHAQVAELDEDARRWVETRLVTPAPAAKAAVRAPATAPTGDLLSEGRDALAEYDFEGARARFTAALERPSMAQEAARALVDLLVNHLGDDEGALELAPLFSARVMADDEVRLGLALAAARLGRRDVAGRLGRGLLDVDLYTRLADLAITDGDLVEAARLLHTLRERSPGSATVLRLSAALAAAREATRRPEEEAILQAEAAGDGERALALARRLIERWPDSAVARRIVAADEARGRRDEAHKVATTAWQAYQRGDVVAAAALAQRARALAPDDTELIGWLDEAREAADEARAFATLHHAETEAAQGRYAAWLALGREDQEAVAARVDRPGLRWLTALGLTREGVAAVEALEAALAQPERAIDLLRPHLAVLRPLPEARAAWKDAEDRVATAASARFAVQHAACLASRVSGDLDAAFAAAKLLVPTTHVERDQARALMATLTEERRQRDQVAEVEQIAARGDFLYARDRARAAGMLARADELAVAARKAFEVDLVRDEAIQVDDIRLPDPQSGPFNWLSSDGERLVLVKVVYGELSVRVMRLDDRTTTWAATVRLPRPWTGSFHEVHETAVTIVGVEGWLLRIGLDDAELLHFRFPAAGQPPVRGMCVSADGRYLWLSLGGRKPECHVVDLADAGRGRGRMLPGHAIPVRGGREIVRILSGGGLQRHLPNGTDAAPGELGAFLPDRVVTVPGGRALIAFGDVRQLPQVTFLTPEQRRPGADAPMGMCVLRDRMCKYGILHQVRAGTPIEAAIDRGALVVKYPDGDNVRLLVVDVDDDGTHGASGIANAPGVCVLATDVGGRSLAMLWYEEISITISPGPTRPAGGPDPDPKDIPVVLPEAPESVTTISRRSELPLGGIDLPFACSTHGDARQGEVYARVYAHLAARRWEDALRSLPEAARGTQHALHIEVVCQLWLGDLAGARGALNRALALQMGCQLQHLAELVEGLEGARGTVLGDYVGALISSDAHRARNELVEARDTAAKPWAWRALERQGLVRIAAAWLDLDPADASDRLHRRMALATVCDLDTRGTGVELPLAQHRWDEAQWRDVVARAKQALGRG